MAKKLLALVVCLLCMVGLAVPVSAEQSFVTFGAETINLNVDLNRSGNTITYTGSASGTDVIGMSVTLTLYRGGTPVDSVSRSITGSTGYVSDTFSTSISGIYRVELEGTVVLSTGSENVSKSKTKSL
ncbi:MAG: hypothetical protein LBM93_07030 [Oscillospiraceae bacterium]|jgi:hypothetical protein|nr:hypothetical protein [Oscillospiraceae bacterium]